MGRTISLSSNLIHNLIHKQDSQTGRDLFQITSTAGGSIGPYVYMRSFSADQRYAMVSTCVDEKYQAARVDLQTGELIQITDADHYEYLSLQVDPTGKTAYFVEGYQLCALNIETLEKRIAVDHIPLPKPGAMCWLSGDGSRLLVSYSRADGRCVFAMCDPRVHSRMEEVNVLPEWVTFCTHVQFCPSHNNLISYNRHPDRQNEFEVETPRRARCYLFDMETGRDEPFLVMPPPYRATHEHWSPDGKRLFFHRKHAHNWVPASIGSIPREGGEPSYHYHTDHIWLGHSSLNRTQTHLVSDSQFPEKNELVLIDMKTGEGEILCWPNASGRPHPYHVHPMFSPSGDMILYTSDHDGVPQVYLLPLTVAALERLSRTADASSNASRRRVSVKIHAPATAAVPSSEEGARK